MPALTMPALYVDDVASESGATSVVLANRVPSPGAVDVASDSTIDVDILRPLSGVADVDTAATSIYVGGVLAFQAGAFQAGYDGPASASGVAGLGGLRVVIDPTADFTSEQSVTVRVVSAMVGALGAVDESHTFTSEDLIAPVLVSALAIDALTVRLIFDEAVAIGAGFASSFSPVTLVAVPLVVVAQSASGENIDLTLDEEMTEGATYALSVSDVEDLSGNTATVDVEVVGFVASKPDRRRLDLTKWVPHRILSLDDRLTGDLRKFLGTLQDSVNVVMAWVDRIVEQNSYELAEPKWLDVLLADLGNPFPFTLDLAQKRKLASLLVQIYRENGTVSGVENAIRFFVGVTAQVVEFSKIGMQLGVSQLNVDWTLGASDQRALYTFSIEVDGEITDEQYDQILTIAEYMKPAHTHIASIVEITEPDLWTLDQSKLNSGTKLG